MNSTDNDLSFPKTIEHLQKLVDAQDALWVSRTASGCEHTQFKAASHQIDVWRQAKAHLEALKRPPATLCPP